MLLSEAREGEIVDNTVLENTVVASEATIR